jgi:hypothetical protein
MRFTDYIRMAFRNISRQKLRSSLTIFAVVIGATSVTIMLAIVFSAKGFITSRWRYHHNLISAGEVAIRVIIARVRDRAA